MSGSLDIIHQQYNFEISFTTKDGLNSKGPLNLLWNLIRNYQVDIFQVSLTNITTDFINYIHSNPINIEEESSFIAMATKLLYYKSKLLLPTNTSEEEFIEINILPKELIDQLMQYRKFQFMADIFMTMQESITQSFERSSIWSQYEKEVESLHVNLNDLIQAFYKISNAEKKENIISFPEEEVIVEDIIDNIYKDLLHQKSLSFFTLIQNTSIYKRIGVFLAILEMTLRNKIKIYQNNFQTDILIEIL